MSDSIGRFAAYADAFEKAYESDDWTEVEPFFAENAVYDSGVKLFMGGHFEGRSAILGYFKSVLDQFDRRFETRELTLLDGPREDGNSVLIRGCATYRAPGVPDLVLVLDETVTFEDGLIVRLEDRYADEMEKELSAYVDQYGKQLALALHP